MNAEELLADLRDRLADAANSLYHLAVNAGTGTHEQYRLEGKREGVLVAKSYTDEALRLLGTTNLVGAEESSPSPDGHHPG